VVQTIKKNCPEWIGIGVRNGSESVSGMDRNRCPEWIGIGVRNGSEYANIPYSLERHLPVSYITNPMRKNFDVRLQIYLKKIDQIIVMRKLPPIIIIERYNFKYFC
ncbi:MAG: hypothetical protein ABIN18_07105, partial [Pseudomonadota bacterium]